MAPAMLATYWREVQDLSRSLRFLISACLFLAGMGLNGYVSGGAYKELMAVHGRVGAHAEERLRESSASLERLVTDFNEIFNSSDRGRSLTVSAPPPALLPLVAGAGLESAEWNFPDIVEPAGLGIANPELPARPALDWEFMVRILLSFVAVILSYDLITGERERGTLALTLCYPVSRRRVLAAKFLAVLSLAVLLLVAGAALSAYVYTAGGGPAFEARDYARVALFVVGSALYVGVFVGVSLLVSSRARSSAHSLTVLLIFWIGATLVVPQGGTSAVQGLVRTLSDVQVEKEVIEKLEGQVNEMLAEMDGFVRPNPAEARKDGFASEQNFARRVNQMVGSIRATLEEQRASHRRQAGVLQNVMRLTPSGLFQLGNERLLGAGEARSQHFLRAVERWSEEYEAFVRAEDALDPESPHVLYVGSYMSKRPADPSRVPRLRFEELPLGESLRAAAPDFALLMLELAAALALAFKSFDRAPVMR